MKTAIAIFLLCSSIPGFSQNDAIVNALVTTPSISIEEQQIEFRKEVRPALVVKIISDEDNYSKDWKNFLSSRYNVESRKASGFYEAKKILIPEWYADTIDLFHKIEKDGDFIRLVLLADNRGKFLSTKDHPDAIVAIKTLVAGQVKDFYIKYYDKVIEIQQKDYERQQKEESKIISQGERLRQDVKNAESEITKSEQSISSLKSDLASNANRSQALAQDLDTKKRELDLSKKELETVNSQVVSRQKEYDLLNNKGELNSKKGEKLTKDLEKLRSEQSKLQDKVMSKNKSLTENEEDILTNRQAKTKLESRVGEEENAIGKKKDEIRHLEKEIETNQKGQGEKKLMVEQSREKLERLNTAKAGLVTQ